MPTPNPSPSTILSMKDSLDAAMAAAGGARLTVEQLKKMSAIDLMTALAPNGVRFTNESVKFPACDSVAAATKAATVGRRVSAHFRTAGGFVDRAWEETLLPRYRGDLRHPGTRELYPHTCKARFDHFENFSGTPKRFDNIERHYGLDAIPGTAPKRVPAHSVEHLQTPVAVVNITQTLLADIEAYLSTPDGERAVLDAVRRGTTNPRKEVFAIDRLERDLRTGEVTYIREQLGNFPSWTPDWYYAGRATKGPRQERDRRRIVSSLMDEVGVAVMYGPLGGYVATKTKNTNDNVGMSAEQAVMRKLAQYLGPKK